MKYAYELEFDYSTNGWETLTKLWNTSLDGMMMCADHVNAPVELIQRMKIREGENFDSLYSRHMEKHPIIRGFTNIFMRDIRRVNIMADNQGISNRQIVIFPTVGEAVFNFIARSEDYLNGLLEQAFKPLDDLYKSLLTPEADPT